MTIFNARDPAAAAAGQLGLMSAVVATTLTDCVMSGLDAMDRGRERRAARQYADDLEEARSRADELGRMAIRSARRVAALEAQVRSLKACLMQRQAFIDAIKAGRVVLAADDVR
jgi:hypothetical protein